VPATLDISALTHRTGVPSDTIRKWQQRYGVLHPRRTAGGRRRYSERDVERIEWLKARIREGYRIREAAALLGSGEAVARTPLELRNAIVGAAQTGDVDELGRLVDQRLARSEGWQVAYLGAETPLADALALAESLDARMLCPSTASRAGADEHDHALAQAPPRTSLTVFVGGRETANTDLPATLARLREASGA